MVWCIAGLFITGLLIMDPISGGPGHEPTFADWRLSVDLIRNIHFLLGFILQLHLLCVFMAGLSIVVTVCYLNSGLLNTWKKL